MKQIIFLSIITFSIVACSKDKLPKATESGKNTFGCKIEGKLWVPSEKKSSWSGVEPILVSNSRFDGFLIHAVKFKTSNTLPESVTITLPYLTAKGTYPLRNFGYGQYKHEYSPGPTYQTNSSFTGTVTITRCDTASHIYSGTFSFNAVDEDTGKTVSVTEGRFDVKRN